MRAQRGFSLLELMITVAIIGILSAIAYPSYQNSVIKGRRAAAQAFLLEVAQKEQQYLLDSRTYLAISSFPNTTLALTVPAEVSKFYTVAVAAPAPAAGQPPTFTATATPSNSRQAADGSLSIDNTGTKTSQYSGKW